MTEKTEIAAELVIEKEGADKSIEAVNKGLTHMEHAVNTVNQEFSSMAKQAAGMALGIQLSSAVDVVKQLGHEFFNSAVESENQVKELAGLLAISSKSADSLADLSQEAAELKDQLEDMGIKAGTSTDSVIQAFGTLAERSERPKEELLALTEKMVVAGNAVRGGVGSIAAGFRDLESGFVRARSPLVQFIRQTHTMKGSAQEIAKQLNAGMAGGKKDEVFKIAEEAISRMAEKAKGLPPTFDSVKQSLLDIRSNVFEAGGKPILSAMMVPLTRLRDLLIANKDKIEEYAKMMGEKAGEWVTEAANKIAEGFQWVQTHSQEIKDALVTGAQALENAIRFILDHKTEIAAYFAIKSGMGMLQGGLPALTDPTGFFNKVGQSGGLAAGAGAGLLGAGAVAAAALTTAAAVKEWSLLKEDIEIANTQDKTAAITRLQTDAAAGLATDARQAADALIMLNPQMKAYAESLVIQAEGVQQLRRTNIWDEIYALPEEARATRLAKLYEKAEKLHDEKTMSNIAGIIASGELMVNSFAYMDEKLTPVALRIAKKTIAEGTDEQKAMGEWLQTLLGGGDKKGAVAKPINLNIGTVNIKQDFRDTDPDRIVAIFRNDLVNRSFSAIQAKTSQPFG